MARGIMCEERERNLFNWRDLKGRSAFIVQTSSSGAHSRAHWLAVHIHTHTSKAGGENGATGIRALTGRVLLSHSRVQRGGFRCQEGVDGGQVKRRLKKSLFIGN